MCVVRRNRDGSILWNVMQAETQNLNTHREGTLIYWK